ncbi:MAG: hypothetical protein HYU37_19110 [Acidobacteria bacterium]|nr:hypothetical protein [Acidobacteriota bacterium]
MRRRAVAWVFGPLLVLAAGASMPGKAADVVEIRLNGTYFAEPATVRFTVAVEPNKANRSLWIEADSTDLYRASEIALSGADEKRLHQIMFKNLTAGYYTLKAEVRSSTGVRGMATREIMVTGAGLQ